MSGAGCTMGSFCELHVHPHVLIRSAVVLGMVIQSSWVRSPVISHVFTQCLLNYNGYWQNLLPIWSEWSEV